MNALLESITLNAIDPALRILPAAMDSPDARVLLLAIGLQESLLTMRFQRVDGDPRAKGPARGLWQFELGTEASRGGVCGVWLHEASRYWLSTLCAARQIAFKPRDIWLASEGDDVMAAGLARLLIFTDAKRLPEIGDEAGAWELYAKRCWRPGRPHLKTWAANYATAMHYVKESQA